MPFVPTGETLALTTDLNDPAVTIKAHLAKNAFPLEMGSVVLEDFEECDFPGYAPIEITEFFPQETGSDLVGKATSESLDWIAGEIVNAQPITAVYLTIQRTGGQPALFWPYFLDNPVIVSFEGQRYTKIVEVGSEDLAGV